MQADSSVLPSSVSSVPRNKPSNIGLSANFLRKARFFAFDSSVLLISHIAHDILFGPPPCPCSYTFRRSPALHPAFLAGLPPCNPATPFEKGVDPKTFSADGQPPFLGKGKNLECRNNGFPGTDLWIPCAVPSVGVLCSRAWWEASSENSWAFGDASHLHDLKRLGLFRWDEVPARNTPDCPASPSRTKKSF